MKKKIFTLLTLLVAVCSGAWAGTETPGNTGTKDTNVSGYSYTIAGTYVAGAGGAQVTPMESSGVKVRLNKSSNTMVISVNDGYQIDAMTIYAVTNDNSKTNSVTSITVDGTEKLASTIVIPNKSASEAATISVTDVAEDNITLTFSGEASQGVFDFHFTYTQNEVIVQEISAVSLNGTDISDSDLATLKSDNAVTIDGSSLNGLGTLGVTLSSGSTTVSREISGTSAIYTFTINSTDEYTITVTNVAKTYTLTGTPVYYSKGGTEATGTNTSTITANGISFAMVNTEKTFQYGTGSATISGNVYVPLKLSTGSAVNVTFPTGKVATKVIVYGWSINGNGAINSISETSSSDATDTSSDIFYATNNESDVYPSVYEYDLDCWESFYFNPGGSASQPFVVMEFVLQDATVSTTIASSGYSTFCSSYALDCANLPSGLTAYQITASDISGSTITPTQVTAAVPAGTGLLLKGTTSTAYDIPTAASGTALSDNKLMGVTTATAIGGDGVYNYILYEGGFYRAENGTLAAGKAYLSLDSAPSGARELTISFDDDVTGINQIDNGQLTIDNSYYNIAGQRVAQPTKGLYIVNGKKVVIK